MVAETAVMSQTGSKPNKKPTADNCKVLIRGHVFDYEEKAPFVPSGKSVFGALEYDNGADKVRCHECGAWFSAINDKHLGYKHKLDASEYRVKHGLNATTGLCTPSFSAKCKKGISERSSMDKEWAAQKTSRLLNANRDHRSLHGSNKTNRGKQRERLNQVGRCEAQTCFKIQQLAKTIGRTPTRDELAEIGIYPSLLKRSFGSYAAALESCELQPRKPGRRKEANGQSEKPSSRAHLLDEPLPWPADYFGVKLLERAPTSDQRSNLLIRKTD